MPGARGVHSAAVSAGHGQGHSAAARLALRDADGCGGFRKIFSENRRPRGKRDCPFSKAGRGGALMFFDTHAHLHFPEYDADRDAVFERAEKAKVGYCLNVATDTASAEASLKIAESRERVWAS